jgi:hypothetical protein
LLAVLLIGFEGCRDSDSVVGLFGLDSVQFEQSLKNIRLDAWVSLLNWINCFGLLYVFQSVGIVEGCCTLMV